ncbi:Iron hydrogenase 1 [uncultured Clostridium sp.]|nr:Iron hydrogenase 1 [uncultured Clostridium sp.]
MVKVENDAKKNKYQTLRRVAELAFTDQVNEEHLEAIPGELIQGSQPHFRCCVYKEREIIRQRVRLATGKLPSGRKEPEGRQNVITVIPAACEGCPINRYRVTENCQKCLAKKCMNACPFGAITMTGRGAYIDPDKCRECGRCAQVCPYNAIADLVRPCKRSCPVGAISINEDKLAEIQEEKCISCGACMRDCPFGAISDRSYMLMAIEWIRSPYPTYAIIAPALEGQFGPNASMGKLKTAVKLLGFTDVIEVGLGADAVAQHEAKELLERVEAGGKMTTSCCPAFVELIRKHYHALIPNMSHTVSPMVATARWIKEKERDAKVVFIGPCVAKKTECQDETVEGGADCVLTAEELLAMFDAKRIDPEKCEDSQQDASRYGKGFAQSGGVTGAVLQALTEQLGTTPSIVAHRCDGAAECKKALAMLASGKFPADFIEGMACIGGCGSGPAMVQNERLYQQTRKKLLAEADGRTIGENLAQHGMEKISMER